MNVTIQIPDELARDLAASGGDLTRRALEGFALEEYKNGRLTRPGMRRLLGFETRDQLDAFLKAHVVTEDLPTLEDFEQETRDAQSLDTWYKSGILKSSPRCLSKSSSRPRCMPN